MCYQRRLLPIIALVFVMSTACRPTTSVTPETATDEFDPTGLSGQIFLADWGTENIYYQITLGSNFQIQDVSEDDMPWGDTDSDESAFQVRVGGNEIYIQYDDNSSTSVVDETDNLPLVPFDHGRDCESRSPDGESYAVIAEQGLYVTRRDGRARLVLPAVSATYYVNPQLITDLGPIDPNLGDGMRWGIIKPGGDVEIKGEILCPAWLGADRLLVDRFAGTFPDTMDPDHPVMPRREANTTSVLDIHPDRVEISDIEGRWQLVADSPNHSRAVMRLPLDTTTPYQADPAMGYQWGLYLVHWEYVLTKNGAQPLLLTPCDTDDCEQFSFSNDGTQLAFFSWGEGGTRTAILNIWNLTQESLPQRIESEHVGISMVWSPDASAIAYTVYPSAGENRGIYFTLLDEPHIEFLPVEEFSDQGSYLVDWSE